MSNNIIGDKVIISDTAKVDSSELKYYSRLKDYVELRNSVLGEYSYVSQFSIVNKTNIGKFCSIANGCYIGLWEHNTDVSTHPFFLYPHCGGFVNEYKDYKKDIIETNIGNDVWVGAGAIIMKGVTIGNGAIVGAGAVVTKNVEAYSIVVGSPAKVVKYRYCSEDIAWLESLKWWDFDREYLKQIIADGAFSSFEKFKEIVKE
jgi:acetyltransferase-like isoleucine patch superfamily enzyme